ncbi:hypothetical protein [Amycolatopsis minnesotensis]|uniref:Uncharacterized protein n=1 Tax=Amycolatopsis minnesotensis TaxID=337894 RepID=A0ABP5CPQ2_9PSEU
MRIKPMLAAAALAAIATGTLAAPAAAASPAPGGFVIFNYFASHQACTEAGNSVSTRFQCWAPADRAGLPEPWELDVWQD